VPAEGPRSDAPYRLSAEVYDRVYVWKNYAAEARRVRQIVRRFGRRDATSLLDVACGTGEHLRHLRRWFRVTGVDPSPSMLSIARRKLPHVRFVRARMQSFRLSEQFDVITCLFSAVGYVRSARDLRITLRNFSDHLVPGGIVLVEPWITPARFRPGLVNLETFGGRELPIARLTVARRRGQRSVLTMHYLVGSPEGVRSWAETHDLALIDEATFRKSFREAGLRARRLASRFSTRRGLWVGVKPGLRPHGSGKTRHRRRNRSPRERSRHAVPS
jgi:SAM-dependent methyltransferase